MTKSDKIRVFRETFRGRQDIVPRHWVSFRTGKSGYSPMCGNEWGPECRKGKITCPCKYCDHADYLSFSDSLIYHHFMGKHILGIYPLLSDNTCYFAAADFDNHTADRTPMEDVLAFYETCQVQDIPCYILRSKSGRGYHSFIFFDKPTPAWKARAVCFALLQEAQVIREEIRLSSFDRLFPNQDQHAGRGFGNLIALPFQGRAAKASHTLLLDPDSGFTTPYKDQWKILSRIQKINVSVLDDLIKAWNLKPQTREVSVASDVRFRPAHKYSDAFRISEALAYPSARFDRIAERCAFIAHCRDDAETLPEPDWYIMLTISARCKDGDQISHHLSRPYPDYTPKETNDKICHALVSTGPYRCKTIQRINGVYCRSCNHYGRVKSPIVLGY